jgi:hypothetical protein
MLQRRANAARAGFPANLADRYDDEWSLLHMLRTTTAFDIKASATDVERNVHE